jgi:pimeloyl-ACP methyl ester carboxylesterase
MTVEHVELDWSGRRVRIEHEWIDPGNANAPLLVFLHEGLGSHSMWRDFPRDLCTAGSFRGLVYSRPGYGRSTPRAKDERWAVDYMHRQAHDLLPALLDALHIDEPPWLVGHSDGASIALIHAGGGHAVTGLALLAPHVVVEDISVASIAAAKVAYETTDLRAKLARYHADVDSAFRGWNRIWLHPDFRQWNIEAYLPRIDCPVLAIQGEDDEYGTMEQLARIERGVRDVDCVALADCRHTPHKDQPAAVIGAITRFVDRIGV